MARKYSWKIVPSVYPLRRSPRFQSVVHDQAKKKKNIGVKRKRNQHVVHDEPKKKKNIGVKRKRNQHEGVSGTTQNWTKDEEAALERAYLEAKPTPHFWKKVSRLVPGKSAQECFDKVWGISSPGPTPPRLRSRARLPNLQDPNLSASKLLSSSSPTTEKAKSRKQKTHVIKRTVRRMLQNQYEREQDSEADLFYVLEPTFQPIPNLDLGGVFTRSSTPQKKNISRPFDSHRAATVSPRVLKQVKDKVLHEKYLDILNCREAKRKVASKKAGKSNGSERMKGESSLQRKDVLKAAKDALECVARDAIDRFNFRQGALVDIFEDERSVGDEEDGDCFDCW